MAAKEPYRVKTARSGCSPKSFRAMEARAEAPAVCELDGPHHDGADNVPQTIGFHKSSFRVSLIRRAVQGFISSKKPIIAHRLTGAEALYCLKTVSW